MIMLLNRTTEWMSVELHAGLVPIYFDCNKLIAKTNYCTIDDCNRYLSTLLQIEFSILKMRMLLQIEFSILKMRIQHATSEKKSEF